MRALLAACVLIAAAAAPLHAQDAGRPPARPALAAPASAGRPDLAETVPPHPLPAEVTTDHVLNLPGRTLHFKATAGAVRLSDAGSGAPIADIAFVAYRLDGADQAKRPLTVAVNGGPGAASAWLDLGAVGPWRLPVNSGDISPAMSTAVVDNADTWLDFTDLLFIDPLGTGYSRALGKGDDAGKAFYSIDGDIGSLATVVRKWLIANDRLASPHFILGESYGGFRAPKLARKLEESEGVGVAGIAILSPVLDFAWFEAKDNPAVVAAHFPSLVAAAKGIKGPSPRDRLTSAESYAAGPYLVDLFKGKRDAAALHRMSTTLAGFLGVDEGFVARLGGRVSAGALTREKLRSAGRIASNYDATVTGWDPEPFEASSHHDDPILDGLKTPFAAAMADVTANRLKWPVQARYEILNLAVNSHWDWDSGRRPAEAMGDLSILLSLDPHFHAIVMHGVTDEVTPYFTSKMLIDQLPAYGDPSRVRLAVYGGGHMPYLDDAPRAAMREDGRKLIEGDATH